MTKAPLGGEKNRPQPYRPRQRRREAVSHHRGLGDSSGSCGRGSEPQRLQDDRADHPERRDQPA
jgi:hypothetical protein